MAYETKGAGGKGDDARLSPGRRKTKQLWPRLWTRKNGQASFFLGRVAVCGRIHDLPRRQALNKPGASVRGQGDETGHRQREGNMLGAQVLLGYGGLGAVIGDDCVQRGDGSAKFIVELV